MSDEHTMVKTPDGRALEVALLGDPANPTVVFHHGTPGAAELVDVFADIAQSRHLCFVTTSRAGYGHSDRNPGRNIARVVADTTAVLDTLGRGRYVSLGWSGGGPHALACAALDAPRCVGAISLAGVAPSTANFDWTEGMGPENQEEFALAKEGGPRYEAFVKAQRDVLVEVGPREMVESMGGLLSATDVEALGDATVLKLLVDSFHYGLALGHYGILDDDLAFFSEWGFDPATISVPVEVWFGDQDLMVPPSHGRYLSSVIPHAVAFHQPDDGHISLVTRHQVALADRLEAMLASA